MIGGNHFHTSLPLKLKWHHLGLGSLKVFNVYCLKKKILGFTADFPIFFHLFWNEYIGFYHIINIKKKKIDYGHLGIRPSGNPPL